MSSGIADKRHPAKIQKILDQSVFAPVWSLRQAGPAQCVEFPVPVFLILVEERLGPTGYGEVKFDAEQLGGIVLAIADDIGSQNGGKPALHGLRSFGIYHIPARMIAQLLSAAQVTEGRGVASA